jgi:hypothetical protein
MAASMFKFWGEVNTSVWLVWTKFVALCDELVLENARAVRCALGSDVHFGLDNN